MGELPGGEGHVARAGKDAGNRANAAVCRADGGVGGEGHAARQGRRIATITQAHGNRPVGLAVSRAGDGEILRERATVPYGKLAASLYDDVANAAQSSRNGAAAIDLQGAREVRVEAKVAPRGRAGGFLEFEGSRALMRASNAPKLPLSLQALGRFNFNVAPLATLKDPPATVYTLLTMLEVICSVPLFTVVPPV